MSGIIAAVPPAPRAAPCSPTCMKGPLSSVFIIEFNMPKGSAGPPAKKGWPKGGGPAPGGGRPLFGGGGHMMTVMCLLSSADRLCEMKVWGVAREGELAFIEVAVAVVRSPPPEALPRGLPAVIPPPHHRTAPF